MKKALVIGGSNGIGLAIALQVAERGAAQVIIIDKDEPTVPLPAKVTFVRHNLLDDDLAFLPDPADVDALVFTAGFGRVAPFESILQVEISNQFQVNAVSPVKVLRHFFPRMRQPQPFHCAVMGSIAGWVSSPLFALYSATKAALCKAIEALNVELEMCGTPNRILNVSPGSIKGTRFNGGDNDLSLTSALAAEIVERMLAGETLFIPDYEEVYKGVIDRYRADAHQFGVDSYRYKMKSGRFNMSPQVKIGYMSGTWDLFHIGHLNMMKRAKQYCDFLVVGVHKDASHKGKDTFIPFEERMEIVRNVKWVDQVIPSLLEDSDVYKKGLVKYDMLFVGSDYKGTERFNRYEEYFADKGVKIIYFPYTRSTSSTQIRNFIISRQNNG
ncbi:MAG: SDR family NAD(P)-dependent oxidoreductase [Muribaculaceae bacterium]|nr:SDR family NAD(P)-dependent oxidoreductase [Muribaculaceae bacterium]